MGKHLKYSSALWQAGTTTLDEAEEAMLDLTCQRARLADGQDVLELGCGWGSLSLYMAETIPQQPDHCGFQFAHAKGVHRGACQPSAG